jgi:hypothetical protein
VELYAKVRRAVMVEGLSRRGSGEVVRRSPQYGHEDAEFFRSSCEPRRNTPKPARDIRAQWAGLYSRKRLISISDDVRAERLAASTPMLQEAVHKGNGCARAKLCRVQPTRSARRWSMHIRVLRISKEDIIQAFYDGIKHKPETTFGNVLTSVYQAAAAIFVMKLTFTPAAVMLPKGKLPFVVALAE